MWSVARRYPANEWVLYKDGQCHHNFRNFNGSSQSSRLQCERVLALNLIEDFYRDRPEMGYRMAYLALKMVEESGSVISISVQTPRAE